MNLMVLALFGLLGAPFIPAIVECVVRKDRGPRNMPDKTIAENELNGNVPRLERARGKARAKVAGEVIRVVGDVSIPDGTEIEKHLVVHGNLKMGKTCHIYGTVKAFGNVEVGEDSVVEGHILSQGRIRIGKNSIVRGIVDSPKEIVLEENAIIEAASTDKAVRLQLGAVIDQRVVPDELKGDLLPKLATVKKGLQLSAPRVSDEGLKGQEESDQADAAKEEVGALEELPEGLSDEQIFERLLASKLRAELSRKIDVEIGQSPDGKQVEHNGDNMRRMFLLPVLALVALLLAEVVYYSPGSAIPAVTALQLGFETWSMLLILSLVLGSAACFYTLRHLGQGKRSNEGHSIESPMAEGKR